MSCYVVDDETINRIVTFLEMDRECDPDTRAAIVGPVLGAPDVGEDKRKNGLGLALHKLNAESVGARYGEPADEGTYRGYRVEPCPLIQAFKSLRCFLYQSCEGDRESPLLKALQVYSDELCYRIVCDSPAWRTAEWG